MVTMEQIQEYADQIAREFKPEKIILFGSYAYGRPTPDSDVDILVVMRVEGKPYQTAAAILTKTKPRFPTDILVRTPEELRKRLGLRDYFLREIVERGKTLYAS